MVLINTCRWFSRLISQVRKFKLLSSANKPVPFFVQTVSVFSRDGKYFNNIPVTILKRFLETILLEFSMKRIKKMEA